VSRRRLRDIPWAVLMLVPSAGLLAVWTIYPLVRAIDYGHKQCNRTLTECRDVGWGQFSRVFQSDQFQDALLVSVKFAVFTVPTGLVLGLALAMLADKHIRGIGVFRVIFSSTVATSVAVASLVWFVLLQPQIGVLADQLSGVFPSLKEPGWLNGNDTALPAVAISSVWAGLGFSFIVVTAALQSVPRELHESALVDGAGSFRRFWHVTLPMISPTLLFLMVVLTTRALQTYGEIALLTGGGPQTTKATTNIPYLIYGENSLIRNDIGLKSAAATLLFLLSGVFAAVQFRGFGKRVHYGS